MARLRDGAGKFVKNKTIFNLGCSSKLLKIVGLIFSISGIIGGFIPMFLDSDLKSISLFPILFWSFITWLLLGRPKFWEKKGVDITQSTEIPIQKTDSQRDKVFYDIYKRQFERIKPMIEAGVPISLDSYEEENLRPFIIENYPNLDVKIVRPQEIQTTIAGFQYHDGDKKEVKKMLRDTPIGVSLTLVRDPNNPHSKEGTATQIHWENYFLGFVPSEYSKVVAEAIDKGLKVSASIDDYDSSKTSFFKVSISIRIDQF